MDHGRCGPTDGPVFNSFINTPSYGDECSFFDARRSDQTRAGSYENVLISVTDGTRQVVLRIYVNNDANEAFGQKTTAQDTRVRVGLPAVTGSELRATAYVSASNATPQTGEDTVDLVAVKDFNVGYTLVAQRSFLRAGKPCSVIVKNVVATHWPEIER